MNYEPPTSGYPWPWELTAEEKEIAALKAKIAKVKEEFEQTNKCMGGLARILFQRHIDAMLKALNE